MNYFLTGLCIGLTYLMYSEVDAPLVVHFILAYMMGAINVMLVLLATNKP